MLGARERPVLGVPLVKKVIGLAVLAVVLVVGVGAALFASDYGVEADLIEKSCGGPGSFVHAASQSPYVVAKTRLGGFERRVVLSLEKCLAIPDDAYIVYHIRSQRMVVFESKGGPCIYDTDPASRCS